MNEIKKPITNRRCRRCGRDVELDKDLPGFVHVGGGMYWQKCSACGWEGSKAGSYQECPECGSRDIKDDHAILA